ncbi:MAG TPA: methyltransferase domain-containing protein [Terracidiphilus sp.]|nr:methyltransferase domain-containing protein [Terracidiphilus sp.]
MCSEAQLIGRAQELSMKGLPDISRRAELPELMEELSSYEGLRRYLLDLRRVNRMCFVYRPTLRWLEQFVHLASAERPLHIVDVGCGGGDVLRRIEGWAAQRRLPVRLAGVDMNPLVIRAAREFTSAGSKIQWIVGRSDSPEMAAEPIDLVISSHFTHHLADDELVHFLSWMERVARRGWFINDLYRSRMSYFEFKVLSAAARWHRLVRYDGPVSVLRSFLPAEWKQYAVASGLSPDSVSIDSHWPGRLCVARVK